jgi:hypothetical protein
MDRVYRAVACQRVDQISYNIYISKFPYYFPLSSTNNLIYFKKSVGNDA